MREDNIGCLGYILRLFGLLPKENDTEPNVDNEILPYALRDDFLSPAEYSFYKILVQAIDNKAVVCPKVSLKDLFFVTSNPNNKYIVYKNMINSKHIDFLVCSNSNLKPICGIELDDSSHKRTDRMKRDQFVDKVFKTANIDIIRFEAKSAYSIPEISERIYYLFSKAELTETNEKTEPSTEHNDNSQILCPKCGIPMVYRITKKGDNIGKGFYGCPNFPKCRETIQQ